MTLWSDLFEERDPVVEDGLDLQASKACVAVIAIVVEKGGPWMRRRNTSRMDRRLMKV